MTDGEKIEHLNTLLSLIRTHGSRADQVRQHILATEKIDPEFRDLAMVVILLYEAKDVLKEGEVEEPEQT